MTTGDREAYRAVLKRVREVAEAATPGPWRTDPRPSHVDIVSERGDLVGEMHGRLKGEDAEFVATFHPQMALALLDLLEKAGAQHDLMLEALHEIVATSDAALRSLTGQGPGEG